MLIVYLLVRILAKDAHMEGFLDRYQVLLRDHEQCVEALADSRVAVKSYENRIINGLQQQVDTLKKELKQSLSAVESQQKELQRSVTDMKEKDESLEEKIESLKKDYAFLSAKAYFSAKSHSALPLNSPIPFPVSISEHESGFNGNTGIMTVKIPGTYFWNCQFLKHANNYVHIVLMHDNGKCKHKVSETHNNNRAGYYMVTLMSTLVLEKNDKVWVEMHSGNTWQGNGHYNQCTAFKID